MKEASTHARAVARRGELIAELVLQEIAPSFVARPTQEMGYDFFVGFPNAQGGINIAAVEVKTTEKPVSGKFPVNRGAYERLIHSNVPVLLLVVDARSNRVYYSLPAAEEVSGAATSRSITLRELDEHAKDELRAHLSGSTHGVSGI